MSKQIVLETLGRRTTRAMLLAKNDLGITDFRKHKDLLFISTFEIASRLKRNSKQVEVLLSELVCDGDVICTKSGWQLKRIDAAVKNFLVKFS